MNSHVSTKYRRTEKSWLTRLHPHPIITDAQRPLTAINTHTLILVGSIITLTMVLLAIYHLSYNNIEIAAVGILHAFLIAGATILALRDKWDLAMLLGGIGSLTLNALWLLSLYSRNNLSDIPFGLDTYFVFQPIYLVLVGLFSTSLIPIITVNVIAGVFTIIFVTIGRPLEQIVQPLLATLPLVYGIPAITSIVLHHAKILTDNVLRQQNVYLREGHYRMKNHIALLSSVVSLQNNGDDFAGLKAKLIARLDAMATVEDQIYKSPVAETGKIPLRSLVCQLVQGVTDDPLVSSCDIRYTVDSTNADVPESYGSRLGIILIELLLNAQKHAFIGRDIGNVNFVVRTVGEYVHIEYHDNGIGLPTDFNTSRTSSLGMMVISAMVDDLAGEISMASSDKGLSVRLIIPADSQRDNTSARCFLRRNRPVKTVSTKWYNKC